MSFFNKHNFLLKIIGLYLSPIVWYFISVFFIYLLIKIYGYEHIDKIAYTLAIIIPITLSFISLLYGIVKASTYKYKHSKITGNILIGTGLLILGVWIIILFNLLPWAFLGFFK